jgi:DNA-binding MarR family transcriptional regulator
VTRAGWKETGRRIASECLAIRVRRLGRVITRIYDTALSPYGISIAQVNLLAAIAVAGGARPTDLTQVLDVEKSTLSRDLKRMEHLGWVRSAPMARTRGRSLTLTPAGERMLVEIGPAWEKAQEMASAELGKQPFERLRKLLLPFAPL